MPGLMNTPPPILAASYPVKRLYMANATPSFVPTMKLPGTGSFDVTTLTNSKLAVAPAGGLFSRSVPKAGVNAPRTTMWGNFTSDPLAYPVTISGTVSIGMGGQDTSTSSTGAESHYHYLHVLQGSTNTLRGTLIQGAGSDHGAGNFIWSAPSGFVVTYTISTPLSVLAGDRIVLETGVFFGNSLVQKSATVWAGGVSPTAIFHGDTDMNHHAWLQFNSIPGVTF